MSDLPGNDYAAVAKFRIEGVHEWQESEGLTDATAIAAALDAQTQATLALAYEQRTANLLAYWTDMTADEDVWEDTPFQRDMDSISRDFRTRMGLTPEIGK